MPPRRYSRYTYAEASADESGALLLDDPEPFEFVQLDDTRQHVVQHGDTLYTLAGRYFAPLPRACGLWWILADFQPEKIVDPTIALDVGRVLYVPSLRTVQDRIFNERRRTEVP